MDNQEVLQKAGNKKALVGEMEQSKINKSNWIAVITVGILSVILMVIEGLLGRFTTIFAIGMVCYTWAAIFYFCQFFIAKRRFVGIMIGAILESLASITMLVLYILFNVGVLS